VLSRHRKWPQIAKFQFVRVRSIHLLGTSDAREEKNTKTNQWSEIQSLAPIHRARIIYGSAGFTQLLLYGAVNQKDKKHSQKIQRMHAPGRLIYKVKQRFATWLPLRIF
jgi:hypothetical protein